MAIPNSVYPDISDDNNVLALLYKSIQVTGGYSKILSSPVTSLFIYHLDDLSHGNHLP